MTDATQEEAHLRKIWDQVCREHDEETKKAYLECIASFQPAVQEEEDDEDVENYVFVQPAPRDTHSLPQQPRRHFCTRNLWADNEPLVRAMPFGASEDHTEFLGAFRLDYREERLERGPLYVERMHKALWNKMKSFSDDAATLTRVTGLPPPRDENDDPPDTEPLTIASLTEDFLQLYCRKCHQMDCTLHGNIPPPDPDFLAEFALGLERDGYFGVQDDYYYEPVLDYPDRLLTEEEAVMLPEFYRMFEGQSPKIALMLGVSLSSLEAHLAEHPVEPYETKYGPFDIPEDRHPRYQSLDNYNEIWYLQNVRNSRRDNLDPCQCTSLCKPETCPCIQSEVFCTTACTMMHKSPNYFRGCNCQGMCRTANCTCFAAGRQCTSLCQCRGSQQAYGQPALAKDCQNDGLAMDREVPLWISESTLPGAGYGLFTPRAVPKGQFLGEYRGELVSHDEAERRGILSSLHNLELLFTISDDTSVDASRICSKLSYVNHSDTPNCHALIQNDGRDWRIGFYASRDLKAEEELFLRYRTKAKGNQEKRFKTRSRRMIQAVEKSSGDSDDSSEDDRKRPAVDRVPNLFVASSNPKRLLTASYALDSDEEDEQKTPAVETHPTLFGDSSPRIERSLEASYAQDSESSEDESVPALEQAFRQPPFRRPQKRLARKTMAMRQQRKKKNARDHS